MYTLTTSQIKNLIKIEKEGEIKIEIKRSKTTNTYILPEENILILQKRKGQRKCTFEIKTLE
jgi:hypothetical protein